MGSRMTRSTVRRTRFMHRGGQELAVQRLVRGQPRVPIRCDTEVQDPDAAVFRFTAWH